MTGRPAALSALALASTARVADSVIAPIRRETRRGRAVRRILLQPWAVRRAGHGRRLDRPAPARSARLRGSDRCRAVPYARPPVAGPPLREHARTAVPRAVGVGRRRVVAQLVESPVSKTGGWGFESLRPCAHAGTRDRAHHRSDHRPRRTTPPARAAMSERGRVSDTVGTAVPDRGQGKGRGARTGRACAPGSRCSTARSSPSSARSSGRPARS